eukprot:TRINITY_DN3268_c0_g1_i1.p1 TRINITY_DN3268_c0_g1~~TRINITY_DN3268_c0_g1_i1.p1  ORF type:complete len:629 (-),score=73.79 TRINITY_DN3268_c0_g1_i1:4031-5917(-)
MTQEIQSLVQLPLLTQQSVLKDPKSSSLEVSKRRLLVTRTSVLVILVVAVIVADLPASVSSLPAAAVSAFPTVSSVLKTVDPNRPSYHVMPKKGWLNDPNGLIYLDGVYHVFFQYNPDGRHWAWTISWGHAASTDLVHWTILPTALTPSANGADCQGCWSGTMTLSKEGIPTIVYTGVAQDNANCNVPQARRNSQYNNLGYMETLMWAQVDMTKNGGGDLVSWTQRGIAVDGPPEEMKLNGWRDPFVYQRAGLPGTDGDYIILVGTGRMNQEETISYGGAVMAYTTSSIRDKEAWKYEGFALEGTPDDGQMWECPWMVKITPEVGKSEHTHVLSVGGSLWINTHPNEPNNPVIFWLGSFNETSMKFERASETYTRIDLGETFYASNRMIDGNGRVLIWGWLRECMSSTDPDCASHDYAGSQSIPRVLKVDGDTLKQEVPEEMTQLRGENIALEVFQTATSEQSIVLFSAPVYHYEAMVQFEKQDGLASGVVLNRVGFSMLIVYDWETQTLKAFKGVTNQLWAFNPVDMMANPLEHYGGPLQNMEGSNTLNLRIFVDGSSVEVFTSSGQVMSLRLYFDEVATNPIETVMLVSYGGSTSVSAAGVWRMNSIWDHDDSQLIRSRALKVFPF